jgi:hypothetical protein
VTLDQVGALTNATLWAGLWALDRIARLPVPILILEVCIFGFTALACLASSLPASMAASGGCAAWCAYHAWKRRKPRHRKSSKVGGLVRDIGHRLVVTSS